MTLVERSKDDTNGRERDYGRWWRCLFIAAAAASPSRLRHTFRKFFI